MNIERVFGKPRLLRALTSLEAGEFERLLKSFEAAWQGQRGQRTHAGQARRRRAGAGQKGALKTPREKLFFVLFYFKAYPLQEVMGVLFDLSQGQVSHWVGALTPLVNAALGRELLLPARRPADLSRLLAEVPDLGVLLAIDGTERPIRRPQQPGARRANYSGKKKAHRKKNLLISSEKRVVYLGPTSAGSVHDKKLADESGLSYPAGALLLKDTGFQGDEPAGTKTLQPKKKPRGGELHPLQETINALISRYRVVVEHAIGGVKRCRIVADTFRNWRAGLVDEVMLAASGRHNLRVLTRLPA